MWDGLLMLLTLSTVMAVASFIAGALPLSFSLSQRQLRFISALGTGVLVGTALIVIIPEGIETLYSAGGEGHGHSHSDRAIQQLPSISSQQQGLKHPAELAEVARRHVLDTNFVRTGAIKAPSNIIVERTPEEPAKPAKGDDDSSEGHPEDNHRVHGEDRVHGEEPETPKQEEDKQKRDPHAYVGVSLVLGFILMYLVDVLPDALAPSKPKYRPLQISLSELSRGPHHSASPNLAASPPPEPEAPPPRSSATTIGLIIHAFADGIALGASTTAPSTGLSLIIFLAIMLHKAPAAFGLTSVLLKQGLSKRTARAHLLLFSLAAPAGALVTWAIVHLLGRSSLGGDEGLTFATGCVLLFSGGTFLYVAMHSMNESSATSHDDMGANGFADGNHAHSHGKNGLSVSDVGTAVVGMLIPLVTQVGHVH